MILPVGMNLHHKFVKYRGDTIPEGLEKNARDKQNELWVDPRPVPSREWRKRKWPTSTSAAQETHRGSPPPWEASERGDQCVGHGQEMRRPALVCGIRQSARSGQTHIIPLHGQHLGPSGAGQERGQHDRTDRGIRFLRDRLKEPGEFLRLHKPIARFLSKELNAGGGIVPSIQAPVPSQIEHLPEESHIIPVEVREFPRTKDREMGG